MIYRFNSNGDMNYIANQLRHEVNNPLVNEVLKLVKVWQSEPIMTKILSCNYNHTNNIGQNVIEFLYGCNGQYAEVNWDISRGLISPRIDNIRVKMMYSTVLNNSSASLEINVHGHTSLIDIIAIISKLNYSDNFRVINDTCLVLNMRFCNVNTILNIIKSIQESFDSNNYKVVKRDWC